MARYFDFHPHAIRSASDDDIMDDYDDDTGIIDEDEKDEDEDKDTDEMDDSPSADEEN